MIERKWGTALHGKPQRSVGNNKVKVGPGEPNESGAAVDTTL
jgi:hypothetical protein